MYNCPPKLKVKKPITDKNKLKQIESWNNSEINKQNTKFRPKKVHFDTTTRFLDACINFYIDEINFLLESGVDVNCADKDNLTAIHQACINSRIDLVDFLLTKNANINVCDKEGWTPLHIAADIGSYELAKYLIDHGARLDAANHDGDLPITFVNEEDYPDLKTYFQKEMDKRKINAEESSNNERAIMLEDVKRWKANNIYDPPIDKVNKSTPVHVAASKNYVEILIELLPLLNPEDLNAQDIDGWTALHAAAHWGHKDACMILINNNADLDIRTRANETILDTVDPDLKNELTAEIRRARIEKEKKKTLEFKNDISLRTDNTSKRRSSIARQSVEWKKNTQMKDPVSERQILIKAGLNSDSPGITTIEEGDEKIVSNQYNKLNITKMNKDIESNLSSPMCPETNDSKSLSAVSFLSTDLDKDDSDIDSNKDAKCSQIVMEIKVPLDQLSKSNPLSNGDNITNDALPNPKDVDESNNVALINESCTTTGSDSDEIINGEDDLVQLRPKSIRDKIVSHRNTSSRLSLVMAPAKSDEAEVMRREKARRVRSIRRSTQAIDLGGYKEIEAQKIMPIINSISIDDDFKTTKNLVDVNETIPCESSIKQANVTEEEKKPDELYRLDNKIIDLNKLKVTSVNIEKEIDKTDFINEMDTTKSDTLRLSQNCDYSDLVKKSPLKYQISCPTKIHQNEPLSYDVARATVTNTVKNLIKRKPNKSIRDPINSKGNPISDSAAEQVSNHSLNSNKGFESRKFDLNTESLKEIPNKSSASSAILSFQNTDLQEKVVKEKNSGSFVARPVFGNSKSKTLDLSDGLKNQDGSVSVDNEKISKIHLTSESSDLNGLKEETAVFQNQISKTILSKMLIDKTTKQELLKDIVVLKEEIKELKEKNKSADTNIIITSDKKKEKCDDVDKISRLEMDLSKMRDENKKLKSQNEALLRVISRIQQELESFRKIQID